jgi:hypothetical protein
MNRYVIEESKLKKNYWVCTDIYNRIVCVFKDKKYNDNQSFTLLEDIPSPPEVSALARWMREMDKWLLKNHKEKVFPSHQELFSKLITKRAWYKN